MENYPGFAKGMTGPELMERFAEHAKTFGAEIVRDNVCRADFSGDQHVVYTTKGDGYHAKAVIIAVGAEPRTLNIPGEHELRGKGVSYCATCDADFFEELDIVVIGNGDAAVEEAIPHALRQLCHDDSRARRGHPRRHCRHPGAGVQEPQDEVGVELRG